jgi:hypothetical protein
VIRHGNDAGKKRNGLDVDYAADIETDSPYKFLNYYRFEDQDIFFGRKAETRILLSDVVMARLVVLFAKTGTGKTSLINAGVRPLLEERGYATFFIRVKEDPVTSAENEILKPEHLDRWNKRLVWEGDSLAARLENVAERLGMPIVLFFDQFEEFFIYPTEEQVANKQGQLARRQEFVSNIARIYHDRKSRVHVVFSMREEWFVDMDIFRDEIPRIFHSDSNLRLRWFSKDQAREAMKRPAEEFGVVIEDEVIDKLLADISVNGEIEPAQLQIICDTLWHKTRGERITLADYLSLGGGNSNQPIARQVLYNRLEEEFEKIEEEDHLQVLYALLPKLKTSRGTKYVRDIPGLIKDLTNDDAALREIVCEDAERQELVERLKTTGQPLRDLINVLQEKIGLIRKIKRDDLEVVELSHDYLVDSLDELQWRVKAIAPRRMLRDAVEYVRNNNESIKPQTLEKLAENESVLSLDPGQAEVLFASALAVGASSAMLWFKYIPKPRAWSILEEKLADVNEAEYVIDLLNDLETNEAFVLLRKALPREEIGLYALGVLAHKETPRVVEFLAEALKYERLQQLAEEALSRIAKSKRHLDVASQAEKVLENYRTRQAANTDAPAKGVPNDETTAERDAGKESSFHPRLGAHHIEPLPELDLGPHYKAIAKALTDGRVVPFLGAGASFSNRLGTSWEMGRKFLPSGYELACYLTSTFDYPAVEGSYSYNVARIAQYIAVTHGPGALYQKIHEIFAGPYSPTSLHDFFAHLSKSSNNGGPQQRIIITTNYDDMMEQALEKAEVPFEVLSYIADGEGKGNFLRRSADDEPAPIYEPNAYRLPSDGSVIIKLSGSVDRLDPRSDSFVLTEDDYIDQLTMADLYNSIPVALRARIQRSHILFLGHSLRDWNVRVILRRIWPNQQRLYKSWAIQRHPDRIEQQLWAERGVEIHNVDLAEYINTLKEHIQDSS